MASLPANDVAPARPEIIGNIILLRPDEVEIRDRIGLLWPERVETIAASMRVEGQIEPIVIRRNGNKAAKRWRLIAGWHRLEAARAEGIEVQAVETRGDETQLRAIEASENIHRRDLGPIEKALHIRALADVWESRFGEGYEGLSPQQIGTRKRWQAARDAVQYRDHEKAELEALNSAALGAGLYGWQADAADAVGLGKRKMRDYLKIHRAVIAPFPTLYEPLARHQLGCTKAAVLDLASIGEAAKRRLVIETIIADPQIKTVDQALQQAGLSEKVQRDNQEKWLSAAENAIFRLSPHNKLALFQSPAFQDKLPIEVRRLLAPIRRDEKAARNG